MPFNKNNTSDLGTKRELQKSFPIIDHTKDNEDTSKNFEQLLALAGGFGPYQFLILVALLAPEIPAAFVAFAPVFVGKRPDSWICRNNEDNSTAVISDLDLCHCNGTIVSDEPESTTIVSEWKLYCASSFVSDFITSIQMLGMLTGSLFSSQISDWYGRKKTYLGVCLTMAAGQCLSAASTGPSMYAFARFLCGAGLSGFMGMSTIYPLEFLTPRWRCLCGSVGPWGEGIMLLAGLAYMVRGWRQFLWISSVPFVFVILCYPLLPESPRWLLRNNRLEEAHRILLQMQRINRGRNCDTNSEIITREMLEEVAKEEAGQGGKTRFSYLDFFYDREFQTKTLFLMGIWFSWACVYFGISYNMKNMKGNPYMNVVYLGLADAVGYPCAIFMNNRLGRRKALIAFMWLGSIFLAALAVLDLINEFCMSTGIIIVLCLLGKFGVAGARSAARCLTGESFPTPIRTMGYGISGVTAGVGGIIAPQLAFFGSQWWHPLPFVAFAVISIAGSALSLLLPETADKSLDEKVESQKSRRNNAQL